MSTDKRAPARPLTGRTVLFCLIGFFSVVAGVNAVMIRAAVSTFGGVETSSSYQAGLAFAREAAAAQIKAQAESEALTRDKDAQAAAALAIVAVIWVSIDDYIKPRHRSGTRARGSQDFGGMSNG